MKYNWIDNVRTVVVGLALSIAFVGISNSVAVAQERPAPDEERVFFQKAYDLTGTWELTITPDDGGPTFVGFYSFGADGNASFSSAGPPIPGLGNPGYGVWKRQRNNIFDSVIKMISYTQNFQFDGTLKIKARIEMTSPNRFETTDAVTIYDPDGNEIVVLGGNAVGKRIRIDE